LPPSRQISPRREGRRPSSTHTNACAGAYCAQASGIRRAAPSSSEENVMSKGMDRKKETKKKPAKTMKEKRTEKNEKKTTKGFAPV
jgi:hypothetical protein